MTRWMVRGGGVVLSVLVVAAAVDGATTPAAKCAAAKLKAAHKNAAARLTCHERGLQRGKPTSSRCLATAGVRFRASFARGETRGGCATKGDAQAFEERVDSFVAGLLGMFPVTTTTTRVSTSTTSRASASTSSSTTITLIGSSTSTIPVTCGGTFGGCSGTCPVGLTCKSLVPATPCACLP